MKKLEITTKQLAEALVEIFEFSSGEERRNAFHAYRILFDEDFYSEACELAKEMLNK